MGRDPTSPGAPLPAWVLRRADQVGVAALVLLSFAAMLAWWIGQGGCSGRFVEIDRIQPRVIRFEVDLNAADWPELMQLPGIGETLARRIVENRQTRGLFLDQDDLLRVDGIGPKTLERVRPYLRPMPDHEAVAGDNGIAEGRL